MKRNYFEFVGMRRADGLNHPVVVDVRGNSRSGYEVSTLFRGGRTNVQKVKRQRDAVYSAARIADEWRRLPINRA
jgi:hypothetical protein